MKRCAAWTIKTDTQYTIPLESGLTPATSAEADPWRTSELSWVVAKPQEYLVNLLDHISVPHGQVNRKLMNLLLGLIRLVREVLDNLLVVELEHWLFHSHLGTVPSVLRDVVHYVVRKCFSGFNHGPSWESESVAQNLG